MGKSMPRDQVSHQPTKNWRLLAIEGPLEGRSFSLGPRTILGRAVDCDVQILTEGVSRQHAAIIENDEGEPYLMDLASKNGTFVDGQPILRVRLDPAARFGISSSVFEFSIEDEPEARQPSMTASRASKSRISTDSSDSDE
jgi:pSer/pThr/pTyr-binding forkhead associated (FHA) protein